MANPGDTRQENFPRPLVSSLHPLDRASQIPGLRLVLNHSSSRCCSHFPLETKSPFPNLSLNGIAHSQFPCEKHARKKISFKKPHTTFSLSTNGLNSLCLSLSLSLSSSLAPSLSLSLFLKPSIYCIASLFNADYHI